MTNYNRRNTRSEGRSARGSTRTGSSRSATSRSSDSGGGRNHGTSGGGNYGTSSGKNKQSRGRAGMNSTTAVVILVVMVVGIGLIGLLTWSNVSYLYDEEIIIPGVAAGDVDIGGLTKDEAYIKLSEKLDEKIGQLSITLRYADQVFTYDSASVNATGDIWPIIDEALLYGHRGKLGQRLDEAKYAANNTEHFSISFGYDENSIRAIIEALKQDLDIAPVEPMLEFDKDAGKITGIEDRTSLLYNPLKYDTSVTINGAPAEIYLDAYGNYRINADIFSTTQGAAGNAVDVDATFDAVVNDLADDSVASVDIITYVVEPTLKEDELKDYTSLVYHSKSGIDSSSTTSRDKNVELALSSFDGMVIMPGEIVSFNETTGERTAENGYLEAPGISQDKTLKLVYGGGVCQAATIMFNAAIMAGCEILDKDSHSWPLYYREDDYGTEARDAMVNWGTSDLVFKNVTEHPIYFDTYVHWRYSDNATHAYCNVYTKLLPDGQSIKYEPVLMDSKPTPEAEVESLDDITQYADKTWKEDASTGLLVYKYKLSRPYKYYEVSQQILDVNGNVIADAMWYKSQYNEIVGLYYTKLNDQVAEGS